MKLLCPPYLRYPQKLSKDKVKTELELNLEAHIDVDTGDTSNIVVTSSN